MDAVEAKKNERQLFDFVNARDLKSMDDWINAHIAEDYVNHSPSFGVSPDKEGLKQMFRNLIQLAPGVRMVIKEMTFENDLLSFRFVMSVSEDVEETFGLALAQFNDDGMIIQRWACLNTE